MDNAGQKVKVLAMTLTWITIVAFAVWGIVSFVNKEIWLGILLIVVGPLAGWLSTIILYAFGELVDCVIELTQQVNFMANKIRYLEMDKIDSTTNSNSQKYSNGSGGSNSSTNNTSHTKHTSSSSSTSSSSDPKTSVSLINLSQYNSEDIYECEWKDTKHILVIANGRVILSNSSTNQILFSVSVNLVDVTKNSIDEINLYTSVGTYTIISEKAQEIVDKIKAEKGAK